MTQSLIPLACVLVLFLGAAEEVMWLDEMDLSGIAQGWGSPQANRSVDRNPLQIGDVSFERGIGTHATSEFIIDLKKAATRFEAVVGVDAESKGTPATIVFLVYVDQKKAFESGILKPDTPPMEVKVDLVGAKTLELVVADGGDSIDHDHADWAMAKIVLLPGSKENPAPMIIETGPAEILTPPAPPSPRINGASVFGARPGRPFLFRIPATGEDPIRFTAEGLPPGITLDETTGILTGSAEEKGTFDVFVTATNDHGQDTSTLRIEIGDTLCLTPPLGWNSWNCWGTSVDDARVRAAADAMVSTGLVRHGWTHINIDDAWEGERDENGRIQTNEKFPDMKALADYLHETGLKLGIYSSPGPKTCAGYEGSFGHEKQDADTWAAWGIDYVKYDWCSCKSEDLKEPYVLMRKHLEECGRDIVYSLCQYGMGKVWEWGESVGGNCWRTTGDIRDSWGSMAGIGFRQDGLEPYAGPGHWNDPDMLVVGMVGWGPKLHPSHLTPDEQYTHISLWCLLASPLLLGCDLQQLDAFTLGLLTNDEVLAVNQDPLGKQGRRIQEVRRTEVWSKPLHDGSIAVGLFNRSALPREIRVDWKDLGIEGKRIVRDLWRQEDLGSMADGYSATVRPHGVVLVKLGTGTN